MQKLPVQISNILKVSTSIEVGINTKVSIPEIGIEKYRFLKWVSWSGIKKYWYLNLVSKRGIEKYRYRKKVSIPNTSSQVRVLGSLERCNNVSQKVPILLCILLNAKKNWFKNIPLLLSWLNLILNSVWIFSRKIAKN